mmetsp:Transcript_21678/g.33294  ORF Transcript_21678/g.33294 Transcript_21678/m.33294 type:complete len:184 (-) Transcript_21678:904-1455(-)
MRALVFIHSSMMTLAYMCPPPYIIVRKRNVMKKGTVFMKYDESLESSIVESNLVWWQGETFALGLPIILVGSLLLVLSVVTIDSDAENTRPPPLFENEGKLPLLGDWVGTVSLKREENQEKVYIEAVKTWFELLRATIFQWRVFSDTKYPVGYYNGQDDNAILELLRALFGFFTTGLSNRKKI